MALQLGSIAPYPAEGLDYCAGMGEDNVADVKAALKGGQTHRQAVEASASKLLHADLKTVVAALRSLLCPADAAALKTDFADFMLRSVREGIGENRDGMIDDDIAHLTQWGFELSQIQVPVLLMHMANRTSSFLFRTRGGWPAEFTMSRPASCRKMVI
jgi:hypothetical protein